MSITEDSWYPESSVENVTLEKAKKITKNKKDLMFEVIIIKNSKIYHFVRFPSVENRSN